MVVPLPVVEVGCAHVAVDQIFDTRPYVERTLAFLGKRFGGAISNQAKGVWRSNEAGLVGETIHIVHTYTTEADLNRYLNEVVDYIRAIKHELQQEAMAFEVDEKLILIYATWSFESCHPR